MHITTADVEDDLGPSKILWVREQRIGLEAVVVINNVACGPAIGGIRMASDITAAEIVRLARAMTFKNAAAGLPHGGGKAGLVANPSLPGAQKETDSLPERIGPYKEKPQAPRSPHERSPPCQFRPPRA